MKLGKSTFYISFLMIACFLTSSLFSTVSVLADAAVVSASPESGEAGTRVNVSGAGYTPGYFFFLFFNEGLKSSGTIGSDGSLFTTFIIPASLAAGDYEIAVMSKSQNESNPGYNDTDYVDIEVANFEVVAAEPSIWLDPVSVAPGKSVSVSGSQFTPGAEYHIFLDEGYQFSGIIDDDGGFSGTLVIPPTAEERDYEIVVRTKNNPDQDPQYADQDYIETATVVFEVIASDAEILLDPEEGKGGTAVTVSGTGFSAGFFYYIFIDEKYQAMGSIDENGEFTRKSLIPESTGSGSYEISVMSLPDQKSRLDYDNTEYQDLVVASFTDLSVIASLDIAPGSGQIESEFSMNGHGFGAGKNVSVYWDGVRLGSMVTADSNGAFTNQVFRVPASQAGEHTLKAVDSESAVGFATFVVKPSIVLSHSTVRPGTPISVEGQGFTPSSKINFRLDGVDLGDQAVASPAGVLEKTPLYIAATDYGDHILAATDGVGYSVSVAIKVSDVVETVKTEPAASAAPETSEAGLMTSVSSGDNQPLPSPQSPKDTSVSFPLWAVFVIIAAIGLIAGIAIYRLKRRKAV